MRLWFVVILLTLTAAVNFEVQDVMKCPPWMSRYVDFHAAKRSQARRITLNCPVENGSGIGDYIRGALFTLRLAAVHDLILEINWNGNFNLTAKLEPAAIDWMPLEGKRPYIVVEDDMIALADALTRSKDDIQFCSRYQMALSDGYPNASIILPGTTEPSSENLHCMYSKLFQPAEPLRVAHDAALMNIFNSPTTTFEYVAVHLRIGGQVGEDTLTRTKKCNLLATFLAQQCAMELSDLYIPGSPTTPILFITDNSVLRWSIAEHLLYRAVGPSWLAHHSAITHGIDYMNEFVDLMLLAGAKCLVVSESGFSDIARWWGGQSCVISVDECISKKFTEESIPDCPGRVETGG